MTRTQHHRSRAGGYILLIIFCMMMFLWPHCACNPQKHVNRFTKRHPELLQKDTITVRDTVIIKSITADTIVSLERLRDTVTIIKDNMMVRVYATRDSVFIQG